MNDDEYRQQLVRLQNAFIEGKIDRETYEQFKAELRESAGQSQPARPAGSDGCRTEDPSNRAENRPALTADDDDQPDGPAAIPRPDWLSPKGAKRTGRVDALPRDRDAPAEPASDTDAKRHGDKAATYTSGPSLGATVPSRLKPIEPAVAGPPGPAGSDGCRLPVPQDMPPEAGGTFDIAMRLLQSRESWRTATEVAMYVAVIVGLRAKIYAELLPRDAVIHGIVFGVVYAPGALAWVVARGLFGRRDRSAPPAQPDSNGLGRRGNDRRNAIVATADRLLPDLTKAGIGVVALYAVATLFWAVLGSYYGELVGKVVGDRFGYVNPRDGAIVGALLGVYQSWRKFLGDRPMRRKKGKKGEGERGRSREGE